MNTDYIISDNWFSNIDIRKDPQLYNMSLDLRNDYYANIKAASHLLYSSRTLDTMIDFDSDVWDLKLIYKSEKNLSPLYFSELPENVKLYFKFFINYYRKKENVKARTIYLRYTNLKKYIKDVLTKNSELSFSNITTRILNEYVDGRNLAAETQRVFVTTLFMFYDYLIRICKIPLLIDLVDLNRKKENAEKKAKEQDTRLPNIPEEVAVAMRNTALSTMRDEEAEYESRLVACAIIMLFNLGVRIDDLLNFKTTDLQKEATDVNGYKISYITYYIKKLSRHNSEAFGHNIFASEECVEAFETMLAIRTSQPGANDSNILFILGAAGVPKHKFGNYLYPFYMYKYHPDICITDKYKEVFTPNSSCNRKPVNRQKLYFPETRQFRVYLCSELFAKGVSLNFINEHLKHLFSYMTQYYNRPEDKLPEYIAYAENVMRTMLIDDLSPIGVAGQQIKENIKNFLNSKNINVVKDFDSVLETLGDQVSIRAKTGGFCFKTSLIPCSQDIGTNKMLCAYNLCPNVYSFYYMLDYTYIQFKAHVEAFEQNYFKGLVNSAQKELVEIKSLILRALAPQIKQLEEEISKIGIKAIIEQHQNLIYVIKDIDNIKHQISEWKQKTVK